MQHSGAHRVQMLASMGWAQEALLREGAPAKLLALLSKDSDQSQDPLKLQGIEAQDGSSMSCCE